MPIPTSITGAVDDELAFDLEVTAGRWPDDLSGEMLISAPKVDPSLPHAFFGFGTMIRLSLAAGQHGASAEHLAWRSKLIDSPSRRIFERSARDFTPGATGFTSPFGTPNMANTAPLPWGDRLFATWDVGRPSELNPLDLSWQGDVGSVDSWGGQSLGMSGVLPFVFSSAHPLIDPARGCMWTVRLEPDMAQNFQMGVDLIRWDGSSETVDRWPIEGALVSGSMHSIAQTENWLILADSGNFKIDPSSAFGGPKSVGVDDEVPVYVVRKDVVDQTPPGTPIAPVRLLMGPPAGHYFGVWDDSDGIRVLWEHLDLADLPVPLRPGGLDRNGNPVNPAHVGMYSMSMAPGSITETTVDPESARILTTATFSEDWSWNIQLSALDWSAEGMASPTLHHVAVQGFRPGNVSADLLDFYGDRVDRANMPTDDTPGALVTLERGSLEQKGRWEYPDLGDFLTSPTFAPRDPGHGESRYSGSEPGGHDGYVIQPVQNDEGFRVEIFDAARVGDGPVAVASAPGGRTVPIMLHSAWMPSVSDRVGCHPESFGWDVAEADLGLLSEEQRSAVNEVNGGLAG